MKTRMIALLILVAVIVGSVAAPVFAASEWYDFSIPGIGTVLAPGKRTVWNGRAIDANHQFSGGKNVSFRVKRESDNVALGEWVTLSPGQRKRLWNNATGGSVTTRVEASTPWTQIPVTVKAQGYWEYNF